MWKFFSHAAQGLAHLEVNIPCQDKVISIYQNDTYSIALADGAGSAKYSHYGAELAVKEVCNCLSSHFDEFIDNDDVFQVKSHIIGYLISMLEKKAVELNCDIKELASTLLFVALRGNKFIIGHIGDGVIGYIKNNELKVISEPMNGEYANITYFITSEQAVELLRIFRGDIEDVSGFVLMSDGTADSLYNKKKRLLANIIIKLLQRMILVNEELFDIMMKQHFHLILEGTNRGDDCSLVLMGREKGILKAYQDMSVSEKCNLFEFDATDSTCIEKIKKYDFIMKLVNRKKAVKYILRKLDLYYAEFLHGYIAGLKELGIITSSQQKYKNRYLYITIK